MSPRPDLQRPTPAPPHDQPSWAHRLRRAQLSARARPSRACCPAATRRTRSLLLPILSDTLTECGYPWEVIVVDCGSRDGTDSLMSSWGELPGFRRLTLDGPARLEAAEAGIPRRAR